MCFFDEYIMQTMVVESASRLTVRRPNSLLLKDNDSEIVVAFESKEEKDQWLKSMNQVGTHRAGMHALQAV